MLNSLYYIFISLRPWQWLKNLVVFGAILFSREFFVPSKFLPALYTFLIFSGISSSMYLINDVLDKSSDRLHFSKKKRPIASGKISNRTALITAAILTLISIYGAFHLSTYLFFITLFYLAVQVNYSLWLKGIIILDVMAIALTFMLRVFAGSIATLTPLSSWLIITTMMLALFLAIGKRRSELTILSSKVRKGYRKTLLSYPRILIDGMVFMMATATLITYSLFTFNSTTFKEREFISNLLPATLSSPKLLMITIPIVSYGIFRYLYLIFEKKEGESPERVLLHDSPLFITVLSWLLVVLFFLYVVSSEIKAG